MKELNNYQYLKRLCSKGREKSLFGQQAEAAEYFVKATEVAETSNDFLCISRELYKSDLNNNKNFAYIFFIKAIEVSDNTFQCFSKILKRKDLVSMVSEFMLKMPDHLFHYLREHCPLDEEKKEIARVFLPLSNFISDPDPAEFIGTKLKTAS